MSCFALRFAFFFFAVREPFATIANLRGGMVNKEMENGQLKMWTRSLVGTRCPHHQTQGNEFEYTFIYEPLNYANKKQILMKLVLSCSHAQKLHVYQLLKSCVAQQQCIQTWNIVIWHDAN